MKKFLAMILALAMVLCLFAGCGDDASTPADDSTTPADDTAAPADGETYEIGFLPMTLDNEFYVTMVAGAEKFAKENNIKLNIQACTDHSSAEDQLAFIETMISSGVDAICITPVSMDGLVSGVQKCQAAGIPLINLDTKLDAELIESYGCDPVPFYGTNNYNAAAEGAQYVLDNYPEGTKIAMLTGVEGQENTYLRQDGFWDTIGDKMELVAAQTANWSVEEGYTAAQNILTANPDVEMFYCCNDSMAIGAMRACEEAGKELPIIGFDAVAEAVGYVKDGKMAATIAQYPISMAEEGLQACLDILNGKTAYTDLPAETDTGAKAITTDGAEEYLAYLAEYGL